MQYKPSPAGKGDHAVVDEEIKYGKTVFYSSVNFVDTFPAREGITLVYTYGSKLLQSKSQRLESLAGNYGLLALVQTTRLTGGYDFLFRTKKSIACISKAGEDVAVFV